MTSASTITAIEREKVEALNSEYRAFEADFRSAGERAWRIGQMLLAIKGNLLHGEFGAWVDGHFEGSRSSAERFMRVAREYEDPSHVTDLSLRGALEQVATPKTSKKLSSREIGDAFRGALGTFQPAPAEPDVTSWSDAQLRKDARATELLAEARQLQESAQDLTDARAVARALRDAGVRSHRAAVVLDELASSFEH